MLTSVVFGDSLLRPPEGAGIRGLPQKPFEELQLHETFVCPVNHRIHMILEVLNTFTYPTFTTIM